MGACSSKSSESAVTAVAPAAGGVEIRISLVERPAGAEGVITYRVSGSTEFVDGRYRAVNLSHYSGPMSFAREGSANLTLMRWAKKNWILFDLNCADPGLLLPGPKNDVLPAGAVKLFALTSDEDLGSTPPCYSPWKSMGNAITDNGLRSDGHFARHAISVSRIDASTYAVSGCPSNLVYATYVNGTYRATTLQMYSGPKAFAREGYPNLVLMRWAQRWSLFNLVETMNLLPGPTKKDVLPPGAQKLYSISSLDVHHEPPTTRVAGSWPTSGSKAWPKLWPKLAEARDVVQVTGAAGRGWDGTNLALLNGEYVQSSQYEIEGAFIWEQRDAQDGGFAFFRLQDGWWRCGKKEWARKGVKKCYVWLKEMMPPSESPALLSELTDPKWVGKWWKDKKGDLVGFQVRIDADSLQEVAVSCKVPSYWTSSIGLQMIPETPECREALSKLLNDTWRQKYTRDRKIAAGDTKVPSGARVLSVLRVENHDAYGRYARYRQKVCLKRCGGSVSGQDPTAGSPVPRFPVETDGVLFGEDDAGHQLDGSVNEMYLFHGTSPSAADSIARNDFDMFRAGSAVGTMFGPGLYFAENASKSDEYAKEGEGIFVNQFALLLCRTVAGHVYNVETKGDKSGFVTSGEYDSVCGDRRAAVGTFREMIYFDSDAVYCEYIVVYSRVFD